MFLISWACRPSDNDDRWAGMVGGSGKPTAIGPDTPGRVATWEIWQATSEESILEGARVRVTRVNGLLLSVRKD